MLVWLLITRGAIADAPNPWRDGNSLDDSIDPDDMPPGLEEDERALALNTNGVSILTKESAARATRDPKRMSPSQFLRATYVTG